MTEYEVGYKKPPKHSQFKKGQSGNPRGRPKEKDPVAEMRERCALEAESWILCDEDEDWDNKSPQSEGDGTAHNKACRRIAEFIRRLT